MSIDKPLLSPSQDDQRIDVPNIKVKEKTTQAEFTKVLEDAARQQPRPQPTSTPEPLRSEAATQPEQQPPVGANSEAVAVDPNNPDSFLTPTEQVNPQGRVYNKSQTDPDAPQVVTPIWDTPKPISILNPPNTQRNPDYKPVGEGYQVPDTMPQSVWSNPEPYVYGEPVSAAQDRQRLEELIQDQQEANRSNRARLEASIYQQRQLDTSVRGSTTQDKPWWSILMSPNPGGEFNPLQGRFGEFGSGVVPGVLATWSTIGGTLSGAMMDAGRVGSTAGNFLGVLLNRTGKATWEAYKGDFSKAGNILGRTWDDATQEGGKAWNSSTPQAYGRVKPDNNPVQQLRGGFWTAAGASGVDVSTTNSTKKQPIGYGVEENKKDPFNNIKRTGGFVFGLAVDLALGGKADEIARKVLPKQAARVVTGDILGDAIGVAVRPVARPVGKAVQDVRGWVRESVLSRKATEVSAPSTVAKQATRPRQPDLTSVGVRPSSQPIPTWKPSTDIQPPKGITTIDVPDIKITGEVVQPTQTSRVVETLAVKPQGSLGDIGMVVAKAEPGELINTQVLVRSERPLKDVVELGSQIVLSDGKPLVLSPSTVDSWAKLDAQLYARLNKLSIEEQEAVRNILGKHGISLPKGEGEFLVKVDDNTYVKVAKGSDDTEVGKVIGDTVEPDLVTNTQARQAYQKQLPSNLKTETQQGIELTNQRLRTQNSLSYNQDVLSQATRSKQVLDDLLDSAVRKLDEVPDIGARTLLDNPGRPKPSNLEVKSLPDVVVSPNKDPFYHGTRVQNLELSKVDPVQGASRSELGTALYLTHNSDEAVAKGLTDVNRHLPPIEGRSFGDGRVYETRVRPEAKLLDADAPLSSEAKQVFIDAFERTLKDTDTHMSEAARVYRKVLETKQVTLSQAFDLADRSIMKSFKKNFPGADTETMFKEADLLSFQREVVDGLRQRGIDGAVVKSDKGAVDMLAVYNPSVLETQGIRGLPELEDTLQHAAHRFNSDSLSLARNPSSSFLKASYEESKGRLLKRLQRVSEDELKASQSAVRDDVNRLLDIDEKLEAEALDTMRRKQQSDALKTEEAYQKFKQELSKPMDNPCL
ncbi:MAG: hypothetical protein J0L70_03080 [Leptolyngbya sp. UWPOB_LEPTO1]|uniref:hypothetical protein n=1 Tax=Leptolyngbya sp. UWPOB_LEPTO1 TaxID=2815653 RepID=UPI001ACBB3B8|nr:hypothetical protein [Leptolyngbya sp. UWPOB_LEPTO1]MBN8559486.1 hypothetical protein [Leptolyngbya sp. UWPOB_LEPTO1]